MISDFEVQALESIIVEHAGPMGKFIVKKSMADLETDLNSITGSIQKRLIDMVLERAIFDKERWDIIRKEIHVAWGDGD